MVDEFKSQEEIETEAYFAEENCAMDHAPTEEIELEGLIEDTTPNVDMAQADDIRRFLTGVYDKPLPARPNIGVKHSGFKDDASLVMVKNKARQTIRENITKLYKTKVKKVAIVGTAMTHKNAPYGDPSWELWGLNDHWNNMPRATRWFEANYDAAKEAKVSHRKEITRLDWLKTCPIPVYMEKHYDEVPMSIRYPYEEINDFISDLDPCGRYYFTNSVSYMIALAIYEGFDIIHLYGVDMAVGSEYEQQRPSCEFWVGIAKGRGIQMYIPEQSDLLKCMAPYGRSQKVEPFVRKLYDRREYQRTQVSNIDAEIAKRQDEIQRLAATKFQYQGAIADVEQTLKVWGQI